MIKGKAFKLFYFFKSNLELKIYELSVKLNIDKYLQYSQIKNKIQNLTYILKLSDRDIIKKYILKQDSIFIITQIKNFD